MEDNINIRLILKAGKQLTMLCNFFRSNPLKLKTISQTLKIWKATSREEGLKERSPQGKMTFNSMKSFDLA